VGQQRASHAAHGKSPKTYGKLLFVVRFSSGEEKKKEKS
jgi:hypothetical protein